MLIYDDDFEWQGFGGQLKLGSGKCRLSIYDLSAEKLGRLALLKPVIVIARDHVDSKMSVRSCSSHIATMVSNTFEIPPNRMQFVEYAEKKTYGPDDQKVIPEKFVAVDFTWKDNKAMHARLGPVGPPLLDRIKELLADKLDREEKS